MKTGRLNFVDGPIKWTLFCSYKKSNKGRAGSCRSTLHSIFQFFSIFFRNSSKGENRPFLPNLIELALVFNVQIRLFLRESILSSAYTAKMLLSPVGQTHARRIDHQDHSTDTM